MPDYIRPAPNNTKFTRTSKDVTRLADPYGGWRGQEGALLNGLLALGYDPALVKQFADADPNRRRLDDAITRALRAGVSKEDIDKALRATRAAATGDTQGALAALGKTREQLPEGSMPFFDAIANRQPLPFLDRGQQGGMGDPKTPATWSNMGRPVEQQRSGAGGPAPAGAAPPPGTTTTTTTPTTKTTPTGTPKGTTAPPAGGTGAEVQGLPRNASDAEVEAWFRKQYGGTHSWLIEIPDFKQLMRDIATSPGGWTVQSVISAVSEKPWWQQHGQNVADYLQTQATNPVGFQQALGTAKDTVRNRMAGYGITLSEERLDALAHESYKWGWTDQQMNRAIADEFDYQEGQTSAFIDKLKTDARNYFIPLDESTIDIWGDRLITGGEAEAGNWQNFLKEQAKGFFPGFATRLDAGENMAAIAKPYATLANKWLEVNEGDIDWLDPKWMGALSTTDPKTGQQLAMSPAEFTRKIKTDPVYRYDYTENAKQSAVGMATGILQKFGRM